MKAIGGAMGTLGGMAKGEVPYDTAAAEAAKAALIACARRRGQPIVVCGGAGGRTDPLRLRRNDLSSTRGDALLAAVRARLRREYGFPREAGKRFRVDALHSDEPLSRARREPAGDDVAAGGAPLGCAGYGSMVTVTAVMGLAAASWAIERVLSAARVDAGRAGRVGRDVEHS